MVQSYNSTDTATTWKNCCFVLSERLDFHIVGNLLITVHALFIRMLTLLSVDAILLLRYVKCSDFRRLQFDGKIVASSFSSGGDQCLLLLVPSYPADIRLEQVNILEAQQATGICS